MIKERRTEMRKQILVALAVAFVGLFAISGTAMAQGSDTSPLNVQANVQNVGRIISVTDIDFGNYDPTDPVALNGAGDVSVRVTKNRAYELLISNPRAMTLALETLNYELYSDAGRTVVWPAATPGESRTSTSNAVFTHNIYGQVPALQDVSAGVFADTVTITLNF